MNIYIDSNVIVSAEIKEEDKHEESKHFMEHVLNNSNSKFQYYTSIFSFLELASAMIRRTKNIDKAYSLLYRVRHSWEKNIIPLPPMYEKKSASFTKLVDSLIETSLKYSMPTGDTIHAQTINSYDMDYVVTWNTKHFTCMTKEWKTLQVLTPTEMLKIIKDMTTKVITIPAKRKAKKTLVKTLNS
jgi:predicted nucleic acid-binding protein